MSEKTSIDLRRSKRAAREALRWHMGFGLYKVMREGGALGRHLNFGRGFGPRRSNRGTR